jgi:thiol:disulfide interchange protein
MLYRFYESKTARKNHDHFSKINKNFGVSAEEYQKVFPNLNFIIDEFYSPYSRNLANKYNLKAIDILNYRQTGINYVRVYTPKIKSSDINKYMNQYTNSNNLNVNCKKYNTTTESCGCPAFKYHPETKCKHINSYIQNQEVVKTEEVIETHMNETNSETHMCMTQ